MDKDDIREVQTTTLTAAELAALKTKPAAPKATPPMNLGTLLPGATSARKGIKAR